MNLPLRIFYTLKEASTVLNGRLKSTEINEDYFLHLGVRGEVRLGIFANPNFEDNNYGVLYSDFFEFEDSELIENIKAITATVVTVNEVGSILFLSNNTIKDIYFNKSIQLKNAFFNNSYSIESQEFSVNGNLEEKFSCCEYYDKLMTLNFMDIVFYSEKHNAMQSTNMHGEYFIYPEMEGEEEDDDDWKLGNWFNKNFDLNQDMSKFQSEREICIDDILILGEDLELILNGQKRELIVKHPPKRINNTSHSNIDSKPHHKRANSINQIVYALAKMADLDLSKHQSAYTQLEAFCDSQGIEIPAKDTCGNLFKDAYIKSNTKNSK